MYVSMLASYLARALPTVHSIACHRDAIMKSCLPARDTRWSTLCASSCRGRPPYCRIYAAYGDVCPGKQDASQIGTLMQTASTHLAGHPQLPTHRSMLLLPLDSRRPCTTRWLPATFILLSCLMVSAENLDWVCTLGRHETRAYGTACR